MKRKEQLFLREDVAPYRAESAPAEEAMVRTQIYLTRAEHEFLQNEAKKRNEPMAAVIRSFVDERMKKPADAWTNNPLLEETPETEWESPEDGSINHDYYAYGGSPKYKNVGGKWVAKSADEA